MPPFYTTSPLFRCALSDLLAKKGIEVVADFNIGEVDNSKQVIRSYDEQEIAYDVLVTIPTNMGADVIERSDMGDELNFVPIDKYTLQSNNWGNIWVIGDAGNAPTSKAGSVAHFMLDTVVENMVRHIDGLAPLPSFDGHANCFIETGFDQGLLIDFNYDVEPLPGKFPLPGIGPFSLLQESPANHWGKMGFRWMYWNLLLKGRELPITPQMTMAGKWA
jgi:sulfide:quinone oxidoreductase